jgi:hypothetical protein
MDRDLSNNVKRGINERAKKMGFLKWEEPEA